MFVNTGLKDSRRLFCPASLTSQGHPLNLAVGATLGCTGIQRYGPAVFTAGFDLSKHKQLFAGVQLRLECVPKC